MLDFSDAIVLLIGLISGWFGGRFNPKVVVKEIIKEVPKEVIVVKRQELPVRESSPRRQAVVFQFKNGRVDNKQLFKHSITECMVWKGVSFSAIDLQADPIIYKES